MDTEAPDALKEFLDEICGPWEELPLDAVDPKLAALLDRLVQPADSPPC